MDQDEANKILDLKLDPETNDAKASSVREYFKMMASVLWDEKEGFSGKRPFGNSGWQYEIIDPVVAAGLAETDNADQRIANALAFL